MGEATLLHLVQGSGLGFVIQLAAREIIAAANDFVTGNLDELHRPGFARLEADRGSGGNIETLAESFRAIEAELRIEPQELATSYATTLRRVVPVGVVYLWPETR